MASKDYVVESYRTSDRDEDCELIVRRPGQLIFLRLSPTQFQASPQLTTYYHRCLNVLHSGEEIIDDLFDDEAREWLVNPFEPLVASFAADPPEGPPTLAKYFFPDTLVLTVDSENEEFIRPRRIEPRCDPYIPWVRVEEELAEGLNAWTKHYAPSQVEIIYDRTQDVLVKSPRRVHIRGGKDTYFFKPFCLGGSHEMVSHELAAFEKIAMANLSPGLRICRLHGVVGEMEGNRLLGMLLTLVDERLPLDRAKASASDLLKSRWATQIKESLAELHEAGLVWGDVKPHNVLIDTQDNAWLVDFGGSYTEGWVDRDEAGTVEGGLHGLAKIQEFLS